MLAAVIGYMMIPIIITVIIVIIIIVYRELDSARVPLSACYKRVVKIKLPFQY